METFISSATSISSTSTRAHKPKPRNNRTAQRGHAHDRRHATTISNHEPLPAAKFCSAPAAAFFAPSDALPSSSTRGAIAPASAMETFLSSATRISSTSTRAHNPKPRNNRTAQRGHAHDRRHATAMSNHEPLPQAKCGNAAEMFSKMTQARETQHGTYVRVLTGTNNHIPYRKCRHLCRRTLASKHWYQHTRNAIFDKTRPFFRCCTTQSAVIYRRNVKTRQSRSTPPRDAARIRSATRRRNASDTCGMCSMRSAMPLTISPPGKIEALRETRFAARA